MTKKRNKPFRKMPVKAGILRDFLKSDTIKELPYAPDDTTLSVFSVNQLCRMLDINRTQFDRFMSDRGTLNEANIESLHSFFVYLVEAIQEYIDEAENTPEPVIGKKPMSLAERIKQYDKGRTSAI